MASRRSSQLSYSREVAEYNLGGLQEPEKRDRAPVGGLDLLLAAADEELRPRSTSGCRSRTNGPGTVRGCQGETGALAATSGRESWRASTPNSGITASSATIAITIGNRSDGSE